MDSMTVAYRPGNGSINGDAALTIVRVPPMPVAGRYLAHSKLSSVERAFLASDLVSGDKLLVRPTIVQAAMLARVNKTYAWWAIRQQGNRAEIEAGYLPLVPAREVKPSAPVSDGELFDIVRDVGIGRVLEAAIAVEQALQ
jgi:hypothetical protein